MSSFPFLSEAPRGPAARLPGTANFLVALAPARGPLPPTPGWCRWVEHDGIAALVAQGTPGAEQLWPDALWRVPGMTRLHPQPAFTGPEELTRILEAQAVSLRRDLARRADCAEYRVSVTGAGQPSDARLLARLVQDLADISEAVRATPADLGPAEAGAVQISLSLMLSAGRIDGLLAKLEEGRLAALPRGLTVDITGPDALRSFPLSLGTVEPPLRLRA